MSKPKEALKAVHEAIEKRSEGWGASFTVHVAISEDEKDLFEHAQQNELGHAFFEDYAITFPIQAVCEQHAREIITEMLRALYDFDYNVIDYYLSPPDLYISHIGLDVEL